MKPKTRLQQLGELLTAMIAVVLSGQANILLGNEDAGKPSSRLFEIKRFGDSRLCDYDRRDFLSGGRHFGVFARARKRIGVSSDTFRRYSLRAKMPDGAFHALMLELGAVEDRPLAFPEPLSFAESSQFAAGGKYSGITRRVADRFNVPVLNFHARLRSKYPSIEILQAVREEMRLVDEERSGSAHPLSIQELAEFSPSGRYHGLYSQVARKLGINSRSLHKAARTRFPNLKYVNTLRAEMARVDAEITANGGAK